QPRYTFVPSKNGLEGTNSFTLRRARLGFNGFLADNFAYRFQYEAANEAPGLPNAQRILDAWVSFKHFDESIGSLTVGQQFVPGYTRRPHKTASVERKFSEVLSPGAVGRTRGISIRKGDMGLPETNSKGYFDNRLHYAVGLFNSPDLSLNNDNNNLMFSSAFSIRPTGHSPSDDEYQFKDRPLAYSLGAAYSFSKDSGTLDTKFQPNGIRLDNEWLSFFADVQAHHWWGWASWAQFNSDAKGGIALNAQGNNTHSLSSTAFTLGLSRSYLLSSENMGWAWAVQYQHVNNEHPSRTMFFRPLTGTSTDELARGMNQGSVYQTMFTWQFDKDVRLINEFSYYEPTDGGFSYPAFISQLQVAF
ncbi:MAG: porin, partial [Cycloclasticus sp.]